MKLKQFKITYGFLSRTFNFSEHSNLIYSKKNSVGKTTLLRALLYALGFNIPNTKNFKFENCQFELIIVTDSKEKLLIKRNDTYCHILSSKENKERFLSLPANSEELHSLVFGTKNSNILNNILAPIYIDQEKGWTLLNRGIVIGSVRFNIDKFIQGIKNIDCSDLYEELTYIENQIKKYRSMLSVADYQKQINKLNNVVEYDSFNDKIEKEIVILEFEKRPLEIELNRLKSVLNKNLEFRKYISDLKLHVIDKEGNRIPVNENTIEGFEDNSNYISARINIVGSKISQIDNKINTYRARQMKESLLFQTDIETLVARFDADMSRVNIDYIGVESMIKDLEKQKINIKSKIESKTKSDNGLICYLHQLISDYAKEMGVDEKYVSPSNDYIFTSDLKSLSGAIFHRIVFAFRLAYIKVLAECANINVPILLDSPRGKEVDEINIGKMIEILKRDFSDHQLIIASIYTYNIESINIIELTKLLLEDS